MLPRALIINMHFVSAVLALLAAAPLAHATGVACNGSPDLCGLRYDQVTYAGTHNSGAKNLQFDCHRLAQDCKAGKILCWAFEKSCNALVPKNFEDCLWDNQDTEVAQQLQDGIRIFDLDTCQLDDGSVVNCHGYDTTRAIGPSIRSTFDSIANWVKQNPNEVITLTFGDHDGDTNSIATSMKQALQDTLGPYLYARNGGAWPTLGQMVQSGKRVVVMMSRGLDSAGPHFDWVESYDALVDDPYFAVLADDDSSDRLKDSYLSNWCVRDKASVSKLQVIDATIALNIPDLKAKLAKLQFPTAICNRDLAQTVNHDVLDTIADFCSTHLAPPIFRVRIDFYGNSDLRAVVDKLNVRNVANTKKLANALKMSKKPKQPKQKGIAAAH
ncbi:PLC-like phosphodiesterase [Geranomyces variabilis]|nr:PLC-like phosphodiesterase [Geranomyces variabilis]KAJ3136125.1 hypothetical protein HDU90_003528 [Geranomyces variabilis]